MRWGRLGAEWRLKLGLLFGLGAFFTVPYTLLQLFPLVAPRPLTPSALDRAIPFDARWSAVYLSLTPFAILVPLLAPSRDALRRHARGFMALCFASFVCFALFPVPSPRPPAAERPTSGVYPLVLVYDRELNSFPSLHAGLAVYSALVATSLALPPVATAALGVWAAAIVASTLPTKQHYAVDLVPGIVLAGLAYGVAFRNRREPLD